MFQDYPGRYCIAPLPEIHLTLQHPLGGAGTQATLKKGIALIDKKELIFPDDNAFKACDDFYTCYLKNHIQSQ